MSDILPLVSVCIANYNGMAVIDDCIRSVCEQVGQIPVEIIVHDDASTDDSAAHVQNYYRDVRLISSEGNVGFCVANNRMVSASKGKYLLLLNNDATLLPDALQTLLSEALRIEQPAILGLPQYDAFSGELVDMGSLFDPFLNPVPNRNPALGDVGMIIGACLWLPRSLWDDLGGFPEWFGSIAEDMYVCCRARLAGHPVRTLCSSGYRHWQGKTFGGNRVNEGKLQTSFRRRALSERNKSFVMIMTYPSPWMYVIGLLHLTALLLEAILLTILKHSLHFWREIYFPCFRAMWQRRQLLAKLRRDIQKSNRIGALTFFSVFRLPPQKLRMLARHGLPEIR